MYLINVLHILKYMQMRITRAACPVAGIANDAKTLKPHFPEFQRALRGTKSAQTQHNQNIPAVYNYKL